MNKLAAVIGAAAVTAVAGFTASSFFSSQAEVASMESTANQMHPGSNWSATDNRVLGSFLCTPGDIPCNSLQRRWETDRRPTLEEFQGLLKNAGWDLPVDGNCQQPVGSSGLIELCSARGAVGPYDVKLAVVTEDNGGPDLVTLRMVKLTS